MKIKCPIRCNSEKLFVKITEMYEMVDEDGDPVKGDDGKARATKVGRPEYHCSRCGVIIEVE